MIQLIAYRASVQGKGPATERASARSAVGGAARFTQGKQEGKIDPSCELARGGGMRAGDPGDRGTLWNSVGDGDWLGGAADGAISHGTDDSDVCEAVPPVEVNVSLAGLSQGAQTREAVLKESDNESDSAGTSR